MSNSDDENDDLIEKLDQSINKKKSEMQNELFNTICDNMLNDIENMRNDIKKLKKLYAKKEKSNIEKKKRKTFITKTYPVPNNICKLLNIPESTNLSRADVTKKIYTYINDNDLHYQNDKRVLRVDNNLSNALNISFDVNKCIDPKDKNGLNIFNLQTYIAKCYK